MNVGMERKIVSHDYLPITGWVARYELQQGLKSWKGLVIYKLSF